MWAMLLAMTLANGQQSPWMGALEAYYDTEEECRMVGEARLIESRRWEHPITAYKCVEQ